MAESGKIVNWGITENDDSTIKKVKMDGTNYVELGFGGLTNTWKLRKPVANISSKSDKEGFNKFVVFLFLYGNTSILYPIINNKGFELYTTGGSIYCPQNKMDLISAYYKELSNFYTRNCIYEYTLFAEGIDKKAT